MLCRFCGKPANIILDLGNHPIPNVYTKEKPPKFPLLLTQCCSCGLIQIAGHIESDSLYNENYGYISGHGKYWIEEHRKFYEKIKLKDQKILEIGSNDGSILQMFSDAIGFEPSWTAADISQKNCKSVYNEFFSESTARRLLKPLYFDYVIANNVFAHIPDPKDMIRGIYYALKINGRVILEVQDAQIMLDQFQFDCIYHEHIFYYTELMLKNMFEIAGFTHIHTEHLEHHGGSLRIIFEKTQIFREPTEKPHQLNNMQEHFKRKVNEINEFIQNKEFVGFGAPAKAVTLAHCTEIQKHLKYIVDETKFKQNKYLPGTEIPITSLAQLNHDKPKDIIILPWNHKNQIMNTFRKKWTWGPRLYTLIPEIEVYFS